VLVVHLDFHSGLATSACAGHLPPVVLEAGPDGPAFGTLGVATGPPLGVAQGGWDEHSDHLRPGSVLLLYTDGLVETRTWDIDEGIERLGVLLEGLPTGVDPARVLDAALELLPAGRRGDDVAVLAARLPQASSDAPDRAERQLPPQSMSVPLARSWAEGWLPGVGVTGEAAGMVLLVVSELVTNAVRQADGPVRVTLAAHGDEVQVEVFDDGHRMPVVADQQLDATGGRGLQLVEALCTRWGVREEVAGKTVWARLET
jgi:anti-sigma regulatory factor (Ser/Thr protein kinase)